MSEKQVKPKAVAKPKKKVIKGETSSGFKYEIPEENLNNYELLEVLGDMEENGLLITKTITMLLGKDQRELLKDHLRSETGNVPADKMSEEIMEIFESQNETKKS